MPSDQIVFDVQDMFVPSIVDFVNGDFLVAEAH
jgi:hypothetical protein